MALFHIASILGINLAEAQEVLEGILNGVVPPALEPVKDLILFLVDAGLSNLAVVL
ncbi:hypothetical protein ACE3MS_16895 [Paenibacillus dendritiformis]|uniref:hypothetical protein n=1 Tax=Paenibacillus dendritiformis TaxID=130049 RepID=UPI0002E9385F|nr:hypothetical protein [Paenibacillus dendritiformis]CAH8773136.1 hypothetical protein H7S4_005884 [Paenibacillus dendritiformis]